MDEILQEKLQHIKDSCSTDDFEAAFKLLKETVHELRDNFNEALKNKDDDINSLFGNPKGFCKKNLPDIINKG
ncbi:27371_t:CDS:2 [Racocetra persica]|uniref:27371_t:CDS:1 n=1 Tax=Racocetra persica TaxID=160502 RepID=A0ACA9MRH8_9GLOM|nr:27371_t:CDS:2 [Racocetra persica]